MAHRFINPYKMGLLGGIAAWASTMEKYNLMHEQESARERQYQVKYGAMADVQKLRSQNDLLLKRLQMESNQRAYTAIENGDDGKAYNVSYRNVYNPDTQQFEPHETGRVPYESKMDVAKQTQEAIAARSAAAQRAASDRLAQREEAIDTRSARREAARDAAAETKDQRIKLGQAEQQTNKDMKDFRGLSPEEKAKEMSALGVPATPDTVDDSTTINHYRKALLQQHKRELGIDEQAQTGRAPSAPAAPGSAQPSFTPDGRQIKYDAQGNPFIKGPDGKPVPYVADANGAPDSPLAMDIPGDEEAGETAPDSEASEGEEAPAGAPLIAGTDEGEGGGEDVFNPQAMDEEDRQADSEDEDQMQGLIGGRSV